MAKVFSEGQTLNLLKLHSESLYFQFFTKADGEKFLIMLQILIWAKTIVNTQKGYQKEG